MNFLDIAIDYRNHDCRRNGKKIVPPAAWWRERGWKRKDFFDEYGRAASYASVIDYLAYLRWFDALPSESQTLVILRGGFDAYRDNRPDSV